MFVSIYVYIVLPSFMKKKAILRFEICPPKKYNYSICQLGWDLPALDSLKKSPTESPCCGAGEKKHQEFSVPVVWDPSTMSALECSREKSSDAGAIHSPFKY